MPWPKQCPKCRSKNIDTTKRTFRCNTCKYFVDNSKRPETLEWTTYKPKS